MKKWFALLLALAMLLSLAACGEAEKGGESGSNAPASPSPAPATPEPTDEPDPVEETPAGLSGLKMMLLDRHDNCLTFVVERFEGDYNPDSHPRIFLGDKYIKSRTDRRSDGWMVVTSEELDPAVDLNDLRVTVWQIDPDTKEKTEYDITDWSETAPVSQYEEFGLYNIEGHYCMLYSNYSDLFTGMLVLDVDLVVAGPSLGERFMVDNAGCSVFHFSAGGKPVNEFLGEGRAQVSMEGAYNTIYLRLRDLSDKDAALERLRAEQVFFDYTTPDGVDVHFEINLK